MYSIEALRARAAATLICCAGAAPNCWALNYVVTPLGLSTNRSNVASQLGRPTTRIVGMTTAPGQNPQGYVWQASQYRYLDALHGYASSTGFSVNASGQVAGESCPSGASNCEGVLWNGETPRDLGAFIPRFLTDTGDIVGNITAASGRAVTWHNGTLSQLDLSNCAGCIGSVAAGANNRGEVVGQYVEDESGGNYVPSGGAVWQNGSLVSTYENAVLSAVNDNGQIVGHLFIQTVGDIGGTWINGEFNGLPGLQQFLAQNYAPVAINNSGVMVGYSPTDDGPVHAALWDSSGVTDLDTVMRGSLPSTVTATNAVAIDDAGEIVVEATDSANGDTYTYLLTPTTVPLPTAVPQFSQMPRTYAGALSVSISDATAHSTIYYTLDGSAPTTASKQYSTPLTISATTTIKAIAAGATGHTTSDVGTATYTIATPATPTAAGGLGSAATRYAVSDLFLSPHAGGADGLGDALASDELGTSLDWGATEFVLGGSHAASGAAQATIPLATGHFASVKLLAIGVSGNHPNEMFKITYADNTSDTVSQSVSDWSSPQSYLNESVALTMYHRITPTGTFSYGPYHLYGYTLPANPAKVIQSLTTPADAHIVVLSAAAANPQGRERPVDLGNAFNVTGVYDDGQAVVGGGLDALGDAYAASLLGTALSWSGNVFELGSAGVPNAVSHATIALPAGSYSKLKVLATCVNGNCPGEPFKVVYSDGTSQLFNQSMSDWHVPQSYPGEAVASSMAYRLDSTGGPHAGPYHLYGYAFAIDSKRTVQSVVLPNSAHVMTFAMTLVP